MDSYIEEIGSVLSELQELNSDTKLHLEALDLSVERTVDEATRQSLSGDMDTLHSDTLEALTELEKTIFITDSDDAKRSDQIKTARDKLRDFTQANDLTPLIESQLEKIVGDEDPGGLTESVSEAPETFSPVESTPLERRSPRAPSPGAVGTITGASIPDQHWMLTYDDGPHPSRTRAVMSLLGKAGVPATFFTYVEPAQRHPQNLVQAVRSGHEVGSHSWSHPDLTKISQRRLGREVVESTDRLEALSSSTIRLFRCPYGAGSGNGSRVRRVIASRGLINVFWNVDSRDWADKSAASVMRRVEQQMGRVGGGIILFHDIHKVTVQATDLFLKKYGKRHTFGKFETFYSPARTGVS